MLNTVNKIGANLQGNILQGFSFFGLDPAITQWLVLIITFTGILLFSAFCYFVLKRYLLDTIEKYIRKEQPTWVNMLFERQVLNRLLHLVPAFIIYSCSPLMSMAPVMFSVSITKIYSALALSYMFISVFSAISAFLHIVENRHRHFRLANHRPVRGYFQIARIIIFVMTSIFVISELLDKSPVYLLTSIGAIATLLLMAFKETISGFIANIQIANSDIVRVGDWIELPQHGVDGDIVEISLNHVKIQNFDKTIVTIPTYVLLNSGMKNWRGMNESGGRRIKRAVNVDINTIKFCDRGLLIRLQQKNLIGEDLYRSIMDNAEHERNAFSRLTNIGVFRSYLESYSG